MTNEQRLMIIGMEMLLKKFNKLPDAATVTISEIISASNDVYNEIIINDKGNEE